MPTGSDLTVSLAGAPTGLRSKVSYDVVPTIGLSDFLSDHIAIEAIPGTTQHTAHARNQEQGHPEPLGAFGWRGLPLLAAAGA